MKLTFNRLRHRNQVDNIPNFFKGRKTVLLFFATYLFFTLADSGIAYLSPLLISDAVSKPWMMGIILGSSSLAGLLTDITFSRYFSHKKFNFFIKICFQTALFVPPLLIFFPSNLFTILLAMILWGIYYDSANFTQYHYINATLKHHEHAKGWGMLSVIKNTALVIGPIVTSILLNQVFHWPLYLSFVYFMVGYTCAFWLIKKTKIREQKIVPKPHTLKQELLIWKTLLRKVWPIYLFLFMVVLVDTGFWTVGILLAEEIQQETGLGMFLIPAYIMPTLFTGLFTGKLSSLWDKQRIAVTTSLIGSFILLFSMLFTQNLHLTIGIFTASIFISITFPEIYAVVEDYVERLRGFENDMIALESSSHNMGYIIGPILAGTVATTIGNQYTLAIFAGGLFVASILAFYFLKRKIRLPQKELKELIP